MELHKIMSNYFYYLFSFNNVLILIELYYCLRIMPRRKHFYVRAALLLPLYSILLNTRYHVERITFNWLFAFYCLVVFVVSTLVMFFLFEATYIAVAFYSAAAYATENITYYFRLADRFFPSFQPKRIHSELLRLFLVCAIVVAVYHFLIRRYPKGGDIPLSRRSSLLFMLVTLVITNFLSSWARIELGYTTVWAAYGITCDILMLMIQFGAFQRTQLEYERDITHQLMRMKEQQQQITQESMEIINIKCHDLKHQIAALRTMNSSRDREKSIEELEHAVLLYDTIAKTGNRALDTVVSEKGLLCQAKQIEFTYIVDAARLSALSDVEIFTLFGNALDNAIEAVEKLPDPAMRIITLHVSGTGGFTRIAIENYIETPVSLKDGLPSTQKSDVNYHGFGLKSIRLLVEKHGGNMVIQQEDHSFRLCLLIPVSE